MNKIDELIQQYCPDGVEYVKLGDVVSISRGASPRPIQNYLTDEEDGIPWIKIGDVSTNSKYITSTNERITREGANKSRFLKKGTFILSNSMSFGRPYILGIDGCIHDGWISICDFEASLNSGFLYYLLRSSDVQGYWTSKANSGGAVANLNSDIVRSTPIPLPPLPVQEAIVNILDRFAVYAAELQAVLQAELQARQQQYNYYRDTLLSFEGREDVKYHSLFDLCNIVDYRGKTPHKVDCGIFLITAKNVRMGYIDYEKSKEYIAVEDYEDVMHRGKVQLGDVLITTEAPCGNIAQIDREDVALAQRVIKYRPKDTSYLNPTFLKYILMGDEFQQKLSLHSTGGTVKGIKGSVLHTLTIPIPPIEEQQKIVDILDRFDTLVNDLSQGLPAEIEARQQQYEYYRDQLLTFKRKEA